MFSLKVMIWLKIATWLIGFSPEKDDEQSKKMSTEAADVAAQMSFKVT